MTEPCAKTAALSSAFLTLIVFGQASKETYGGVRRVLYCLLFSLQDSKLKAPPFLNSQPPLFTARLSHSHSFLQSNSLWTTTTSCQDRLGIRTVRETQKREGVSHRAAQEQNTTPSLALHRPT